MALKSMEDCITDVRSWMLTNKLKINDSKTEFLILGSKQQLRKITILGVQVGDDVICPVSNVRNLDVLFDKHLAMDKHISKICSTAYFHLHNIRIIRKYLTHEAARIIIQSLVSSQLDYCNALLSGIPCYLIKKLQHVQNAAARVIFNLRKYDHISPALNRLHWLSVKNRIDFKVLLIVFKALHNKAPQYITDMIVRVADRPYNLRSNEEVLLQVLRYKSKTLGGRAFAIRAPALWNTLPAEIRSIDNISVFKQKLKTFLWNK
jgi:hypothetical protein